MTEMVTKEEWLTALRSGEYKQAYGSLCRVDDEGNKSFCCLGVYMDLLEKRGLAKSNIENDEDGSGAKVMAYSFDESDEPQQAVLPKSVVAKSFFPDSNPNLNDVFDSIAEINDEGHTFSDIADLIESNGFREKNGGN